MEIILKEDIIGLGYKNDIVNVKSGYGRNYLIPTGKGVIASESAKKVLAENLRQQAHKLAVLKQNAEEKAKVFEGVALEIPAKVSMTGQQLLDAMEVSVASYPVESGDFHICSGLRYCIDSTIPSSVIWDKMKMFAGVGDTRRIVRMEVEAEDGSWLPVDPEMVYTVSGLNYTLLSGGASGMFRYARPMETEDIKDTEVLQRYLHMLGDTIRTSQYPEDLHEHRFEVM